MVAGQVCAKYRPHPLQQMVLQTLARYGRTHPQQHRALSSRAHRWLLPHTYLHLAHPLLLYLHLARLYSPNKVQHGMHAAYMQCGRSTDCPLQVHLLTLPAAAGLSIDHLLTLPAAVGGFEFPIFVTMMHFISNTLLSRLLLYVCKIDYDRNMSWRTWWMQVVPIGVGTAVDIVLSNIGSSGFPDSLCEGWLLWFQATCTCRCLS